MFTGLVEDLGEVISLRTGSAGGILEVKTSLEDIKVGDSVAVNGACLTAVEIKKNSIIFELSPETLSRTNLKSLKRGELVNLERALRADSRLGGHFVLGHVDFVGKILSFRNLGQHRELVVEIPPEQEKFFVEKGSVAIDGISLTVNSVENLSISINIIPHTYENTNLKFRKAGDGVNVEVDILGKYVVNYLSRASSNLMDKLRELF
ncbi:MAG: riboflavin synthase [Aquificae bacterium]|nr:riboflavin synthase [Aquificota bacterium]